MRNARRINKDGHYSRHEVDCDCGRVARGNGWVVSCRCGREYNGSGSLLVSGGRRSRWRNSRRSAPVPRLLARLERRNQRETTGGRSARGGHGMSEFNVHISLKGAAFDDLPEYEVARILREIAEHVENDGLLDYPRRIHDVNGNRVGFYQAEGN